MTAVRPLDDALIECSGVYLEAPNHPSLALRGLSLTIEPGAMRPLLGPAGAGKSALLAVLAGLARPRSGAVVIDGADLTALSDAELREVRRTLVGIVRGDADLVPSHDVRATLQLPLRLAGAPRGRARRRSDELIELVGLEEMAGTRADRLPPLAAVRAAVAAALAHDPALLLLDEPGARLSADEREELIELLRRLNQELGATVLLATRDRAQARRTGNPVLMREGRVVSELVRQSAFSRGEGERVEELAVVDGDGRIALPSEQRAAVGIGRRARVTLEDDHVGVWPERPPPDPRPPWQRR